MDAITAAYGSSSSASGESSGSDSDEEASMHHSTASGSSVGEKRKRADEAPRPQWKRAFPHVDGQWPSHVRIGIQLDSLLRHHVDAIIGGAQELVGDEVTVVPLAEEEDGELHLSLSRPFVLTYNQIDPFVDALRSALKWRKRFQVQLGEPLVLVNDERTRSFLALRIEHGRAECLQTLKCIDRCMTLFKLTPYYQDPIPHVSIASTPGEALDQLSPDQLVQLNSRATLLTRGIAVTKVQAVIGNKHFEIPLA